MNVLKIKDFSEDGLLDEEDLPIAKRKLPHGFARKWIQSGHKAERYRTKN